MSYKVEKKIEFSSSLTGMENATNIQVTYGDGHDQYRVRLTGQGHRFQFYLEDEEMDGLLEAIRDLNVGTTIYLTDDGEGFVKGFYTTNVKPGLFDVSRQPVEAFRNFDFKPVMI